MKKNILHVVDKLSAGGATIHGVTQLFSWWFPKFDRERYNIILCSLRDRDRAGEYLESFGIHVYYLRRGKYDPRILTDIIRLMEKEDVDLLHLHGYAAATFGRLAAKIRQIPTIIHEHMYDSRIPGYQKLADQLLSSETTLGIAVSQSVKDFLVKDRFLHAAQVEIIYNGAPSIFTHGKGNGHNLHCVDADPWKKQLKIPPADKVVAIVGRLHPIKGHTYFLQAAKKVLEEFTEATFLVIGDGELMEVLQDESRALNIQEKVVFMGYCTDVASVLKEVDIGVIASISEGIPLTLFEAMAAGVPVVSTDVGGIKEILENGKTGYLVASQDVNGLAEKIKTLLRDPNLRDEMGKAASDKVRCYDVANNVRAFEAIYDRLLQKQRK
jgi:glycosyltransferase involved in cell wall biosynthesis